MTSNQSTNREPDWARVPPNVPTYPNPPAFFRFKEGQYYTEPQRGSNKAYFRSWDPWHAEFPDWRKEHYRIHSTTPLETKRSHEIGVELPPYRATWEKPAWRQDFLRQGLPESETVRARGIRHVHGAFHDKNLYQFSNAMTSTQYKKPVPSVYGPMKREQVYGIETQHNRHGYMPAIDHYF